MNKLYKKTLLSMSVLSLLLVGGCSSSDKKEKTVETEKVVKLIKNSRYVEPLNPSNVQTEAFNRLSAAVEAKQEDEEAKEVAVSFAYDFFTLSNKTSSTDIGGLQFMPSNSIGKFIDFAQSYYYSNYPTIVNEYGKASLLEVINVKVESAQKASLAYLNNTYDGYTVSLSITYADTKAPDSALRKTMTVSVVNIKDYDFNRSYNYKKAGLVLEGEMKSCYRVIGIDD